MASSSRESLDDYAELSHRSSNNPTAIMTQNLLVEIRQAVYEAQPKGIATGDEDEEEDRGCCGASQCGMPFS